MPNNGLSREDVEQIVDQKLDQFKQERMRNQNMIKSLQEEVERLREELDSRNRQQRMKGKRESIDLEHKVVRAVAEEMQRSRRNVADPDAVKETVSDQGELKSMVAAKIDELVEKDILIRQSSGDLVVQDPDMEDVGLVDEHYENMDP